MREGELLDGKYRIVRQCGQGGMSTVFIGINERANKTWAIKEVRKDTGEDYETFRRGLITETELLKKLHHPGLVQIVDVIEYEEAILIVMDYLEGKTLKEILDEGGAQKQENVINWALQICDVLDYLHTRTPPIIYRDLKPSNLMLGPDGRIVLFDFGTAREYKDTNQEDTTCLGTRGYAAPEQYGGMGQTDERTDIYCLGTTLYHLLTGKNPGEPPYELLPIRELNPAVSAGLASIVETATRQDPDKRYQSAQQMADALRNYWRLDDVYRKKQNRLLLCWNAIVVTAALFWLCGIYCYRSVQDVSSDHYDAYLQAALTSVTEEERIENYKKAIDLRPDSAEAYIRLLEDCYLADEVFSEDENRQLRQILISQTTGEKTYEQLFMQNKSEYALFSYEMGMACYYYSSGTESIRMAEVYFANAASSDRLSRNQRVRAAALSRICGYHGSLGRTDASGDKTISYKDYFADLSSLTEGNLTEEDNEKTALIIYRELLGQLAGNAVTFAGDGVSTEEMTASVEKILEHAQKDFSHLYPEEEEKLYDLAGCARQSIASAKMQKERESAGRRNRI